MRLLPLALTAFLACAPARAQLSGEPLMWEVVGEPIDPFDLWPDAEDIVVTDSVVYLNGREGLFRLYPGATGFAGEAWELLTEDAPSRGLYLTSTGVVFAIGRGVIRSTDGGFTFDESSYFEETDNVFELPASAPTPGVIVANETRFFGIARSLDEGATWTTVDLDDLMIPYGFAWAPPSPRRAQGVLATVGRGGGAYSLDGGLSWRGSNLTGRFAYLGETVIYSEYDDTLYAMINGNPDGDEPGSAPEGAPFDGLVWSSVDGSRWELRGWVPVGGDQSPGQIVVGAEGALWATVPGASPGSVSSSVYSSSDGGRTWVDRGRPDGEALVGNALRNQRLRMGPDGRLWLGMGRGGFNPPAETGALLRTVAPVTVAAEGGPEPGKRAAEVAVWPNPAQGRVTVRLTLPEAAEAKCAVYDVLGRAVAVLHDGPLGAATHRLTLDTSRLPAGLYLVRATSEGFAATQRITVLR